MALKTLTPKNKAEMFVLFITKLIDTLTKLIKKKPQEH